MGSGQPGQVRFATDQTTKQFYRGRKARKARWKVRWKVLHPALIFLEAGKSGETGKPPDGKPETSTPGVPA